MSRIKSSLSRQTLLDCFIFVPSWEHRSEKRREKVIDTAQATTFGVSFTGAAKQRHCHCAVVQRQLDNSRYTTRDSHSTSHSGSFVLKQNKFDRTPLPIQSRGMFSLSVVRESELVAHQIRNSPLRGSNWQISGGETNHTMALSGSWNGLSLETTPSPFLLFLSWGRTLPPQGIQMSHTFLPPLFSLLLYPPLVSCVW